MEVTINNSNFELEVIEGSKEKTVLVDFFATWCGPCRMMSPVIDELAEKADGKYKVCKLDIDECEAIAAKYNVRGVPTFIAFKNGVEADRVVGAVPKESIEALIK